MIPLRSLIGRLVQIGSLSCLLVMLATAAEIGPEHAADSTPYAQWNGILDQVAETLAQEQQSRAPSAKRNDQLSDQLGALLAETEHTKQEARQALEAPRAELNALGPEPKEGESAEAAEITRQRREIEQKIANIEARIQQAELIAARAEELLKQLSSARQTELQQHLLARAPALFDRTVWQRASSEYQRVSAQISSAVINAWRTNTYTISLGSVLWLMSALAVGALLIWSLRRWLLRRFGPNPANLKSDNSEPSYAQRTLAAFVEGVGRGLLPAIALIVLAATVYWQMISSEHLKAVLMGVCAGLVFYLLLTALARAALAPVTPAWRIVPLSSPQANSIMRNFQLLTAIAALMLAIILATWQWAPFDTALDAVARLVGSTALALLLLPLLQKKLWQSQQSDQRPGQQRWTTGLRWLLRALLLSVPVLALSGYTNLASFLIIHLLGSSVIIIGLLLLHKLLVEVGDSVLQDRRARATVADSAQETIAAADSKADNLKFWLHLVINVLLLLPALAILALFWGVPKSTLTLWGRTFLEDIKIGELTFSPGDFLLALFVFVIVLIVTRVLKRVLRDRVISRTGLDSGVQHSLTVGFGYLGILVALLLTVAVLGISLTNLALIFGALSIGVGLGLQSVVNNFVSGLILLIQRPIKVGDWVVVGEYEGFVKNIRAISTELETFDQASIIIPNSEMVSSVVVNWTHTSRTIRISIKVGVAYDAEISHVREVLLQCAAASDEVLSYPEPEVLFIDFGPSSLDFELRVYILNADNNLRISSDIRTEVAQALRAAEIDIPFPQQDLQIKNVADIVAAITAQQRGNTSPAAAK